LTELATDRAKIRPLTLADVGELLELRLRNRDFFTRFEPRRADHNDGYTTGSLAAQTENARVDAETGRAYAFGIFTLEDVLVGRVALSNVVRGAWQNATLGYYVAEEHGGKGYATDGIRLTVHFAFLRAGLHRVEAAVMPRNKASIRVLEKAAFRHEGFAPHYLQINGVWEGHELFAITTEDL
jgi:ribosomal-protein-alanine N-acetyltransferase